MNNQQSLNILLVDDDYDDQFFFREALSHIELDIRLSVANNHHEAMKYLMAHVPHFVFLDINMPLVTGKESLKKVRSEKKFDEVKVIMLTTSSNEIDIDECYQLGANLYVVKPMSSHEQISILKNIFILFDQDQLKNISRKDFVFSSNGIRGN